MSPLLTAVVSIATLILVGILDFVTGQLSVVLLYFLPIGLGAWFIGRSAGLILSTLSLATWLAASL